MFSWESKQTNKCGILITLVSYQNNLRTVTFHTLCYVRMILFTPCQLDLVIYSFQFSSVAQSCPILCDLMNCSTLGIPVHHLLPEFTQTQGHRVGDAIQPSHPLSSSSHPAPNPSQHQGLSMSPLFTWGGQSIGVSASASVLPMNIQDWSPLGWTGWISLQSKGLSRVFSNTTVQKHKFFTTQLSL